MIEDYARRSKRETKKAINAGVGEIADEFTAAKKALAERTDLTEEQGQAEQNALVFEVAKKYKRLEGRARYQNSPGKLMERDARARLDAEREK